MEGGIRLEEAPSREPAEVVEESREENARRRAEMVVLVEAEAEAALGQRTRAPVAPRAAAVACAEIRVRAPHAIDASSATLRRLIDSVQLHEVSRTT